MKPFKICVVLIFLLKSQFLFSSSKNKELIKNYLDRANIELDTNLNPSRALFYNIKAEELLKVEDISDIKLLKNNQLGYASTFRFIGNIPLCIKHTTNVVNFRAKDPDYPNRDSYFWYYSGLAIDYWKINKDSSEKYFDISLQIAKEQNMSLNEASTYNNLGMFSVANNELEKAYNYYMQAAHVLEVILLTPENNLTPDSIMDISIADNIAEYHFIKKDTLKGIQMMEDNINFLATIYKKDPTVYKRTIRYGIKLSKIYIGRKEFNKAKRILYLIIPHLNHNDPGWKVENEINIRDLLIKIYKIEYNNKKATQLIEERNDLYNQLLIIKEKENASLSNATQNYMSNNIKLELGSVRREVKMKAESARRKIIALITSILIALCFVFLLIINYRRKLRIESSARQLKEKELKLTNLEREKLEKNIQNKRKDISNSLMLNSLKIRWGSEVIDQLEKLLYGKVSIENNAIQAIIKELKQKKPAYEMAETLQKGIKNADTSFYERLLDSFPNITSGEKELCGLIRMNLTGNDIATIRNINPTSVKKLRQRLRKKMNLNSDQDLYKFIGNI